MKVLIFTQHFPPETVATGRRAFDLAESLAGRGHRVTVITGRPNHPSSLSRSFSRAAPRVESTSAGYRVLRVPVFRSQNTRTLNRLLTYGTFALSAAWAGLRQQSPAVIVAVSPLPTGLAAMLVHWRYRVPLIFDLQDIWPDSALAVGVMHSSLALRMLRRLECFFYRRCALIVGITGGFRRYLLDLGVKPDRVAVIHNGADSDMFSSGKADQEFRNSHQLDGKFVVGYTGNVGLAQGLDTLLHAAETLLDAPVKFLIVGEGTDKPRLRKLAQIRGLENVEFLDGVPRERVTSILAACDAFLLILRRNPLFEITIPSKLYEYMAAGKPILCSVGGEAAGLVSSSQCGLPVEPSDGSALAGAVEKLRENPAICHAMGKAGLRSALEHFSRDNLMADYAGFVESVASAAGNLVARFALPAVKAIPHRKT
jgi:putative colanic acid biosynthesis glycosyltransferase WcaI